MQTDTHRPPVDHIAFVHCVDCDDNISGGYSAFIEAGLLVNVTKDLWPIGLNWIKQDHQREYPDHDVKVVVKQLDPYVTGLAIDSFLKGR